MATLTLPKSNLLRNALRANGVFSGASGLIATVGAVQLADWMGAGNPIFYGIIGVGLMFHAVTLFTNSRDDIRSEFAWYAILGDVAWVIATAYILLTDSFGLSSDGKWLLLIIGDIVLTFAIVQYVGLRRGQRA